MRSDEPFDDYCWVVYVFILETQVSVLYGLYQLEMSLV